MAASPRAVGSWTCDDVTSWLRRLELAPNGRDDVIHRFVSNSIDGRALRLLTEADLKEMGLDVVGVRKCLISEIRGLISSPEAFHEDAQQPMRTRARALATNGVDLTPRSNSPSPPASRWPPEYLKLLTAFAYINFAGLVSAVVLVIAHQRLPDVNSYPPLPDLILDNLPHVSWAFDAAEAIVVMLFAMLAVIVLLHRHKVIILRRVFTLFGTVLLLRSVTMVITSLSVPGKHLQMECQPMPLNTLEHKVKRAFQIWAALGMALGGVKTCGDYMFSGHSVTLTLLNFFITEYTPSRWHTFHTFIWLLYVFGLYFILAAHEHYSIDVFVAVYISSRLFLYYHAIANNRSLMTRDQQRWRLWFPMLHFFECGCDGVVPNEYGSPVPQKVIDFFFTRDSPPLKSKKGVDEKAKKTKSS